MRNELIGDIEYRTNALGHKVPVEKIRTIDLMRDDLVMDLFEKMNELKSQTANIKKEMMKIINDFIDLSASEYGVEYGGAKGNVTLSSFNGIFQVRKAIGEYRHFDERIQAAKALIDECVIEWSNGANDNLKMIVDDAFSVNKQGKIDINQVLGLRKHNINDPKWWQAMDAIADSIQVTGSAEYLRFYYKDESGKMQQVNIDFSRV